MKFNNNIRRFFKKGAVAGYISLSLAFSSLITVPAYAGPADDIPQTTTPQGPGQTGPGGGTPDGGTAPVITNNYYDKALSDPIVNPVDKYSYDQMTQDIYSLAARYPGLVNVNVIGQSLDGKNIYDVVIGTPRARKKILFQGALHAREYITVPLMMQQIEYMAAHYSSGEYNDKPLSSILSQVEVHFVPMVNPDGVAISQMGEAGIQSDELRQNIPVCYALDVQNGRTALPYDQYLTRWKSNARGVDLNHNFDAGWEQLNPNLNHNSFTDYKGPNPLSEPESQALANLVTQHQFSAVINYHAMGRVLYWDTEGNRKLAESQDMANAAAGVTGYQVLNSKGVGGLKDWLQRIDNPIPGITIEIGKSACPVAFSEYPAIWDQNKQIPILFSEYILTH